MNSQTESIIATFATRLDTLSHLLHRAGAAWQEGGSFLQRRLAPDMLPLGTQVAFTCNQPRNFALWLRDQPADNLNPDVPTLEQAHAYISETKHLLSSSPIDEAKLSRQTRIQLRPGLHAEFTGAAYVSEFLLPNFYFHLVTAYCILRANGLDLGKRDYMLHLLPFLREA